MLNVYEPLVEAQPSLSGQLIVVSGQVVDAFGVRRQSLPCQFLPSQSLLCEVLIRWRNDAVGQWKKEAACPSPGDVTFTNKASEEFGLDASNE